MKRVLVGVVVVLLLIGVSGVARAEEGEAAHAEEGTEVEVGVKAWFNKWEREWQTIGDSSRSKCTRLFGPTVEVKFANHVFAEASYLTSLNDYRFNVSYGQVRLDRKDIDMAVGYAITPAMSVLAGYRDSSFSDSFFGDKETSYGPLVGVRGSLALSEKTFFYGGLNCLLTRFKGEDAAGVVDRDKSPGWIAELGVKYEVASHTGVALGYKYETTKMKALKVKDTFAGLTFGVNYAF